LDRCTRPAEKRGTAHADLLVGAQVLADQCKQSAGDSIWVSRTIILYFIVHLLVFTWFLPISEDKRRACYYFHSSMRHVIDVVNHFSLPFPAVYPPFHRFSIHS
jgi:hypothetical protein